MEQISEMIEKQIKILHLLQIKAVENGYYADIELAETCLRKQIPKKPIIESWTPAKCPSCRNDLSESLGDGYYKHWYNKTVCDCGQKLNWEDK